MSESATSYYITGLLRQPSAELAKEYLEADTMSSLKLTPSDAPAVPQAGQIYFDAGPPAHFFGYDGTNWLQLDN